VDINNWDSFKIGLLKAFSIILTSRTTTINMTSLLQGTNKRVTNYYIRVDNVVNDIESLQKLDTQRLPAMPWQEAADDPQFMAFAVDVRARILLSLVDFGIQDCLDYVSLNLFVSGLKPNIWEEVMRQAPKVLDDAFDMAVQSEKINFTPQKAQGTTALHVMPVNQTDSPQSTDKSEADLLAALEDTENKAQQVPPQRSIVRLRQRTLLQQIRQQILVQRQEAQPRQRRQMLLLQ
jgi:hypothetical protein